MNGELIQLSEGFRVRATLQLRNAALIEAREARGWTQIRLAREVGCSNTVIGNLERLKGHLVSPRMAARVAEKLGLPVDVVRPPWSAELEVPSKIESTATVRPEQMSALAVSASQRGLLPAPDQSAELEEQKEILRGEVDLLPDSQRLPVVLHYFHGLNYDEIAEILEIAPKTVGSRIYAARQRLRESISEREMTHEEREERRLQREREERRRLERRARFRPNTLFQLTPSEFPPDLEDVGEAALDRFVCEVPFGKQVLCALDDLGVYTFRDLTQMTMHDLFQCPGFGVKSMEEVLHNMGRIGLSLRGKGR